jgi:phytoene synthase
MTEGQAITHASRSNLALAFFLLPAERRRDISDFYAFCRVVDDIADGSDSAAEKAAQLENWRRAIRESYAGEPALAPAVRALISKYRLPEEHFLEIIAGVEMDLTHTSYATWNELRQYCHRVASVVGLVSIEIFGAKDPASREYALNLGLALQLTNILRDVGQDLQLHGRVYLPEEDMIKFGVTRENLVAGRHDVRFTDLMRHLTERAESFYRAAVAPRADRRALAPAEMMRDLYHRLLWKMRVCGWHVFQRRYRLSRFTKLLVALRGWVRSW